MCQFNQEKYTHDWIIASLKKLMHAYNYTPEVLADLSGYSASSIRAIANESREWKSPENFIHLLKGLAKDGNVELLKEILGNNWQVFKSSSDVIINFSIDDEISDLAIPVAKMKMGKEFGNHDLYYEGLKEFREIGTRFEAEGNAL